MFDDLVLSSLSMVTIQNLKDFLQVGNISQNAYDKAMKIKQQGQENNQETTKNTTDKTDNNTDNQ
ncbi:hypothetical protein [Apilactobacillus xinyiensis]|uniref:hypothetical protein n=1 Tax=Apilactobacillus xinyiensis TaxID=2841032 RepID=UPI003364D737